MRLFFVAVLFYHCAAVHADAKIPVLNDIPSILADTDEIRFNREKQALKSELLKFQTAGNAFNVKPVENQTDEEFDALAARRTRYIADATAFNQRLGDARDARIFDGMVAAVKNSQWSDTEKDRAEKALNALDDDGDAATSVEIRQIWKDIQARRGSDAFARLADQGKGPGLPGAGNQTAYEDCAIFALANAAGVPYGFAAARAAEFIREGEWRPADERANPGEAIEKHGLMGGEMILVAEAFGDVHIVPSWEFANTLRAGRPVMVNLVPYSGAIRRGHAVVLTKTFQHSGATWFELIDSNEAGARQRLYLNEKELGMLLKENGVSYRPEDDRAE